MPYVSSSNPSDPPRRHYRANFVRNSKRQRALYSHLLNDFEVGSTFLTQKDAKNAMCLILGQSSNFWALANDSKVHDVGRAFTTYKNGAGSWFSISPDKANKLLHWRISEVGGPDFEAPSSSESSSLDAVVSPSSSESSSLDAASSTPSRVDRRDDEIRRFLTQVVGEESALAAMILDETLTVHGCDHPDTLAALNNLGTLLQKQGKLDLAEPFLRRSFEGCERLLGRDAPNTLYSANNLRLLLEAMGEEN